MWPGYRMIDLSVPLEHASASEPLPARIRYAQHDGDGLQQMRQFLGVRYSIAAALTHVETKP